jgi:hypothetical protein
VEPDFPEQIYNQALEQFQQAIEQLDPEQLQEPIPEPAPPGAARRVRTTVEIERLERLNKDCCSFLTVLKFTHAWHAFASGATGLQRMVLAWNRFLWIGQLRKSYRLLRY